MSKRLFSTSQLRTAHDWLYEIAKQAAEIYYETGETATKLTLSHPDYAYLAELLRDMNIDAVSETSIGPLQLQVSHQLKHGWATVSSDVTTVWVRPSDIDNAPFN
jgi:hypothetical protein